MDQHRRAGRQLHPLAHVLLGVLDEKGRRDDDVDYVVGDPLLDVQAEHGGASDRVGHPYRQAEGLAARAPNLVQHPPRIADQRGDQVGIGALPAVLEQAGAAHEVVLPALGVVALDRFGGSVQADPAHLLVGEVLEPSHGLLQPLRPAGNPLLADQQLRVVLVIVAADQPVDLALAVDVVPVVHAELQPEVHAQPVRLVHHDPHRVVAVGPKAAQVLPSPPLHAAAQRGAGVQAIDQELHAVHLRRIGQRVARARAHRGDERIHRGAGQSAHHQVGQPCRAHRRVDRPRGEPGVVDPGQPVVPGEPPARLVASHHAHTPAKKSRPRLNSSRTSSRCRSLP